jgi:hypothetical protein
MEKEAFSMLHSFLNRLPETPTLNLNIQNIDIGAVKKG